MKTTHQLTSIALAMALVATPVAFAQSSNTSGPNNPHAMQGGQGMGQGMPMQGGGNMGQMNHEQNAQAMPMHEHKDDPAHQEMMKKHRDDHQKMMKQHMDEHRQMNQSK